MVFIAYCISALSMTLGTFCAFIEKGLKIAIWTVGQTPFISLEVGNQHECYSWPLLRMCVEKR